MDADIETKHTTSVEAAVQSIYKALFPTGDLSFVPRAFAWTLQCFNGSYRDYQAIDARYHDLEHTLQGTLCFARILHGRSQAGASPIVAERSFQVGLLAILLHDTGYLKKRGDTEGTGAKYTLTHVNRSMEFASELLAEKGFAAEEIKAVQNMIRCTGVNADLKSIGFQNETERVLGFCLGTADLLGQMAAKDYVDKLPILYSEFAESAEFNHGKGAVGAFASVQDLMQKTPFFWEKYVAPKIEKDFAGVYKFLNEPYPGGPNGYVKRIEANLARLKEILARQKI